MEAITAQVLSQAQNLRGLCAEFAHGARRDAFLALVDADIEALLACQLRITVIVLDDGGAELLANIGDVGDPAQAVDQPQAVLALLSGRPAQNRDAPSQGSQVLHLPLCAAAQELGICGVNMVLAANQMFASPALVGQLLKSTDLIVVCGRIDGANAPLVEGLAQLSAVCEYALHWRAGGNGESPGHSGRVAPFRHWQTMDPAVDDASLLSMLASPITAEVRQQMVVSATWSRLAQTADLLQKAVQAEVVALKFRTGEMVRMRQAEDASSADLKEQTEPLRATLELWAAARKDEIVRGNEDGVLPFDPRLLASRLTIDNLILRQEHSAAEAKYPWLKAKMFQTLVSHRYTVVPDPAAIDAIRSQMLKALDMQVRKDVDLLNQQSGELVDQLRRSAELYPVFAIALKTMRLPVLQRANFDRLLNGITLDADIEDSHTRLGLFKRLAEGRMFASMAFSFVTMSAGVFVLFGEPSIKRGLMKFSGVIVIVMVLYFVFSMLVKSEEEKKSLEEKLEKMREQVNQAVMRPLGKAEQGAVKTYQAFVEEVKACVTAAIDGVLKQKGLARARVGDLRKSEDELVKGFLARRQQAGTVLAQKLPQFVMGLEKARQVSERPPAPAVAPGSMAPRAPLVPRPVPTGLAATRPLSTPAPAPVPPSETQAARPEPVAPRSAPAVRSAAMERVAAMARARTQIPTAAPLAQPQPDKQEGAA